MASFGESSVDRINGRYGFCAQKTTADRARMVKLPNQPTSAASELLIHLDEFGRHETIISITRANRPISTKSAPRLGLVTSFGLYTFFHALRLFTVRHSGSPIFLEYILEKMKVPEKDILNNPLKKAAADNPLSPPESRKYGCSFCNFERWAEPKGMLEDGVIGFASNPFPFAGYHDVHIIKGPFHNVTEILDNPIYAIALIRAAFFRARHIYRENPAVIKSVFWGISYGIGRIEDGKEVASACASFQHIHSQLIGIQEGTLNPANSLRPAIARFEATHNDDFFTAYITALENEGLLVKSYNDHAFLVAPWAQRSKHHLRIIGEVPSFLAENPGEKTVDSMGLAFYDALRVLAALGIRSFNCVSLDAGLENKNHRLVIDVIPRGGIAQAELEQMYVVDGFPENTAKEARTIIEQGSVNSSV
jgi:galactose-1-phosphate uridylyltransferase